METHKPTLKPPTPIEPPKPIDVKLHNRYSLLSPTTEDVETDEPDPITEESVEIRGKQMPTKAPNISGQIEECSSEVGCMNMENPEHPYSSSLFVPGKIVGKVVNILLDSGCTTNLLSKRVLDRLPEAVRDTLQPPETAQGLQADGSPIVFLGTITLNCRLRTHQITESFLVCKLKEDCILGMPFLMRGHCTLEFDKATLTIGDTRIPCVDRYGRELTERVYVVHQVTLPPRAEKTILCRINTNNSFPVGAVSGNGKDWKMASSVNQPDHKGRLMVRCLNPSDEPIQLRSGLCVGRYYGLEENEVSSCPHDVYINDVNTMTEPNEIPEHLRDLIETASKDCSPEEKHRLVNMLSRYHDVFSKNDDDVGLTNMVEHEIPIMPGTRPIKQPVRRLGIEKEKEVDAQVKSLLDKNLIQPAQSAWSSPVVLVKRKDGKWRFCIDYRRLNAVTQPDVFPLPRIDESLEALSGSKYFSTLDLISGYWQVPLSKEAKDKSTFITRNGLWSWNVLPFGLTSAPATFQRLMENVLHGLHWKTLLLYLDDIIVIAPDFDSHLLRLEEVFQRLRLAGLKLKPSKCFLMQEEVKYLGHVVSNKGVSTDPHKIDAVSEWPKPTNIKELRAFMGTVGYYRQYIQNFSKISGPLSLLTHKKQPWIWLDDQDAAFNELKDKLRSAPILQYPDPSLPYILDTDASAGGVGAVLSQEKDGKEGVIAYYSKSLSPSEKNYCVTRRELLAVIKAAKHFRPYLYGKSFRLRTDHASLIWLCKRTEPTSQVARWLEILSEFTYSIEHREGSKHGNADGLSRRPCSNCSQCQHIEDRDGGPTMDKLLPVLNGEVEYTWNQGKLIDELESHQPLALDSPECSLVSTDNLLHLQCTGKGPVSIIYRSILQNKELDTETLALGPRELKRLHDKVSSIFIDKEGILKISNVINGKKLPVAIAPASIRQQIIWDCHSMAHSGTTRTLARLRLNWFWPSMTQDVSRVVQSCEICQAAKHGNRPHTTGKRRLYAGRPWQILAVDLVGPMPTSNNGNHWILVMTDHFTRWSDAIGIPDATAPVVAEALDKRIFCYHGLPEQIHTDQGAQFESALMQELCRLWRVNKSHTTPYNPKANGIVERNNKTLGDSLRSLLLGSTQSEWDDVLPQIMRAHRATPNATTGETPNFLMYGREMRLPDQVAYHVPDAIQPTNEYIQRLQANMQQAHDLLRKQQWKIRTEDSDEPPLFQKGELVLMKNYRKKKGDCHKLSAKYVGPYVVLEAFENHTYRLKRNGQESIQNESRLKCYKPCSNPAGQAPALLELPRRPNMRGYKRIKSRIMENKSEVKISDSKEPLVTNEPGDDLPLSNQDQADSEVSDPSLGGRRNRKRPAALDDYICNGVTNVDENHKRLRRQGSHEQVVHIPLCDPSGSFSVDVCSVSSSFQNMDVFTNDMDRLLSSLMEDDDELNSHEEEILKTPPGSPSTTNSLWEDLLLTPSPKKLIPSSIFKSPEKASTSEVNNTILDIYPSSSSESDGEVDTEDNTDEGMDVVAQAIQIAETPISPVKTKTPTIWMSAETKDFIDKITRESGKICSQCQKGLKTRASLVEHVKMHRGLWFCPCGISSGWRSTLIRHFKDTNHDSFWVDEPSFAKWKEATGANIDQFPTNKLAEDKENRSISETVPIGPTRRVVALGPQNITNIREQPPLKRRLGPIRRRVMPYRDHRIRQDQRREQEFEDKLAQLSEKLHFHLQEGFKIEKELYEVRRQYKHYRDNRYH